MTLKLEPPNQPDPLEGETFERKDLINRILSEIWKPNAWPRNRFTKYLATLETAQLRRSLNTLIANQKGEAE